MTTATERRSTPEIDVAGAARTRHPLRWVASVVLLVLAAQLVNMLVTNGNFQWDVVGRYVNAQVIGTGIVTTLFLTVIAMAVGVVGGVLIAMGRLSENPVARVTSGLYVWFFRGTPVLVQLVLWYNLSALMPRISLGIPFGPSFVTGETNQLITPLLAAVLGLGLNEVAYMAEIIRGGLLSVDPGQTEAASALGMSRGRTFRKIVLPQAMRFIVPPTGSQVISMLKATSLVSVIALADLLYTVQSIYNRTFQTIPLLIVACIWYLVITSILYIGQSFIERHYARGATRNAPQSFWSFLLFRRRRPPAAPTSTETPS
ncbi:amino acid ABC transporter permease [Streptosporangium sp. NBC_01639]|uniref:amino acid ABC transporter permease n=1 Tax=unclassified Streptosporangium TaxID=2632669 RepID=UPI002DDA686A|nr:amino acid ABC transporter permease [Streptosporangium sp. NBC_01756]WSC83581.1 amino acid ABC transporter permease [Streptosporangium sp. NBC_01756]WTD57828.1 amino acid ABC transporter permease [Streptosporangium sp. NBC_01639]